MKKQKSNSSLGKDQTQITGGTSSLKEAGSTKLLGDSANSQTLLNKAKPQFHRHQSFRDSTNEEFKSTRFENKHQSYQMKPGSGNKGAVGSFNKTNLSSANKFGGSQGHEPQLQLHNLKNEQWLPNGSASSSAQEQNQSNYQEANPMYKIGLDQGDSNNFAQNANLHHSEIEQSFLQTGDIRGNGSRPLQGLNNQHQQVRSHSTEKSSATFKSKLESKVGQMTQDDSNMGTRSKMNHSSSANSKSQIQNQIQQRKNKQSTSFIFARTGIEQPYMRERPRFIDEHKEFEPIHCLNSSLPEELARQDGERLINPTSFTNKIVYDCIDVSPFYDAQTNPYFDESEAIEFPSDDLSNEFRKYPYGPSMSNNYSTSLNNRGMKVNKYYQKLKPYYKKQDEADSTLIFESRFESGNLRRAVQVGEYEYDLILKYDYGTSCNTQWYYFNVGNTKKDIAYKFNIINLIKPDSTYNQGMKPLLYSKKTAELQGGIGWHRDGQNICYYQNSMKKKGGGFYYTLTFQITFNHDDDEVFFSYCFPYTYSDCCELLNRICTSDTKDKIRKTVLCKTIAGNECEMVIITNFTSKPEDIAVRRAIVLTARVHPGESNASYVMQGTLEYLVSEVDGAQYLRNNFVFKIVPMLNPDGVIVGNYRCSLSGQDLNRQWGCPSSKMNPENFSVKMMMKKTLESRDILFYCDYHGHSRLKNIFMYGCSNLKADRLKERIFPLLFHKNTQHFSFNTCNFVVQKGRESTARIVMWKEFNLINSFTLEASFCGPTSGLYKDCHFTSSILKDLGKSFCSTLIDYASNEVKVKNAISELEQLFPLSKTADEGQSLPSQQSEKSDYKNDNTGGNRTGSYFGQATDNNGEDDALNNGGKEKTFKNGKAQKKLGQSKTYKKQQSDPISKSQIPGYSNASSGSQGIQRHFSENQANGYPARIEEAKRQPGLSSFKDKSLAANKKKVKSKKATGSSKAAKEQDDEQIVQQTGNSGGMKVSLPTVKADRHSSAISH